MEMRQLKDRLLETETQMNRILKAMEMVQRQVGQTAEDHMSQQARAAMNELQVGNDHLQCVFYFVDENNCRLSVNVYSCIKFSPNFRKLSVERFW